MENEKRLIPLQKRIIYAGDVFNSLMAEKKWSATEAADFMKEFRTLDAVEVVRCKDCRYYTEQKKRCDHPCLDYDVECYDHWLEMEPLDFCSYGERKDNGLKMTS